MCEPRNRDNGASDLWTLTAYTVKQLQILLFESIPISFTELSVGMTTEGIDVRSVGNTLVLHETALIEAFNLKAAIEYQLKNCKFDFH